MATLRENQVQPVQGQPVNQVVQKKPGEVYELPVEKPKYETMGGASQASASQASTQGYTPKNAIPVNGSHAQKLIEEAERQRQAYEANPRLGQAYTDEELLQKYWDIINAAGSNSLDNYSQRGGYVYDGNPNGVYPGTGEKGWSLVEGVPRTVQEGTSGADEDFMSDGDYAIIQELKKRFAEAQAKGDQEGMNAAHEEAERIRARYNYSGGSDGSFYLPGGNSSGSSSGSGGYTGSGAGGGNYTGGSTVPDSSAKMDELRSLLEEWKKAATEQKQNSIDYAVDNAVKELERALEDAQPKYKEQMESVAKDEMQSLDNSALYAEMRGDKGGIGQSQYNEIQAAAAQNKLAVQQAQTKLSTDTARQIADLRAQGEFEKADAALEVAQTYLSQLMQLEQWAAEYNLSAAQFEASLQQWQAEYELSMKKFQTDTELSWAQLTGKTSDGSLTLSGQSQLASMGQTLLSAGIMPSDSQLSAMGITAGQTNQYLQTLQLSQAASSSSSRKSSSSSSKSKDSTSTGYDDLAQEMFGSGITTEAKAKAYLLSQGYSSTLASAYAKAYAEDYRTLKKQHDTANSTNAGADDSASQKSYGWVSVSEDNPGHGGNDWIAVPGYGRLTWSELEKMVDRGEITETYDPATKKYTYRKNPNYKK